MPVDHISADHPFLAPPDPPPANPWSHIQPAPAMLPPGIHLLQSQEGGGSMMIVAIDLSGKLLSIGCIRRLLREEIWFPDQECVVVEHTDVFFQGASRRALGIRALSPGIHAAPWTPRFAVGGAALLVVNALGRIAGVFEVPADQDPNGSDVLAGLERVARESVECNMPPRDL